jgi:fatty-acyl-CoA synthase
MVNRNPYELDLDKNAANYVALSPLSFIQRTAAVYPNRTAVVHGDLRRTWHETYERCVRLASALQHRGIGLGDTVAVMAPNIPELLEAHFGVPMAGAVLNALNIRLDAETIAFILQHSESKVLITDSEFSGVIGKALELLPNKPLVIDIDDPRGKGGTLQGELNYEQFLAEGDPKFAWKLPADEWQAISLNYTSGTTGNPKGVVYHHRGAYLNAIGNVLTWAMPHFPTYLWTLPMFHCNGWCFPWTITAIAGTHLCLRQVTAKAMYDAIADHKVTHMCGAPIVMGMLVNAPPESRREIPRGVQVMTAGAAPPAAIIEKMQTLGFEVTHVYGLTEVYGPVTVCAWQQEWNALPAAQQAVWKARQGVPYVTLEGGDGGGSADIAAGTQRRQDDR